MTELRNMLAEYLRVRRSLGYDLRDSEYVLVGFITYTESEKSDHITIDLALRWTTRSTRAKPATRAARLAMIRRFAIWCAALDPRTEIPPSGLLPHRYSRTRPHIYTEDEITRIVEAARELPSPKGLRAHTYATIFGLLAATGMRISEALALDTRDVDLDSGILAVRRTKFRNSRLVPIHPSTRNALSAYVDVRDRLVPVSFSKALFVSEIGTRITGCSARYNFARVSQQIGLRERAPRHGCGPRLHDMRHRFAVQTLINWYRAGVDVEREIPKLSTYLGPYGWAVFVGIPYMPE